MSFQRYKEVMCHPDSNVQLISTRLISDYVHAHTHTFGALYKQNTITIYVQYLRMWTLITEF